MKARELWWSPVPNNFTAGGLQVGEKPIGIIRNIYPTNMEQARVGNFYHSQLISWLICKICREHSISSTNQCLQVTKRNDSIPWLTEGALICLDSFTLCSYYYSRVM